MQQNPAHSPDPEPGTPCILNPLYEPCVVQRFDVGHGYQAHHWKCVQAAPIVGSPCVDQLAVEGFEVRPALEPGQAAHLTERLKQADGNLGVEDLGNPEVETVLRGVLNPTIHQAINRNFLTEFAVIYFGLSLTRAASPGVPETSPSFLWHCDFGPSKFLNVLVYLNGDDEHDAATAFLDRQTTRSFKSLGYVFCPTEQRLADLGGLAATHGLAYQPVRLSPEPGQAILFEPSGVLHRGIGPTRGLRCTLHLVLIPWAEPWDSFLQKNPGLLSQNREFSFPKLT